MTQHLPHDNGKAHWRSLDERSASPELVTLSNRESPNGIRDFESQRGFSRRGFLGGAAATATVAASTLTGCDLADLARKPQELIVPYGKRPEDLIPGKPVYYATAAWVGGSVLGLLVESQEGRPTKIEGNPGHPNSMGSSDAFAQAVVASLYDDDRSRTPLQGGKASTWKDFDAAVAPRLASPSGEGVAVLMEHLPSPTRNRLVAAWKTARPGVRFYRHDLSFPENGSAGMALAGMKGQLPVHHPGKAKVILAADSNFLGTEGERVRNTREFAEGRRVEGTSAELSRLYVVEPSFSLTGAMADHRMRLKGAQVGPFLAAVASQVFAQGGTAPAGAESVVSKLTGGADFGKWPAAVAKDLLAHKGQCLILVGERQPAAVHALGALLNMALGNVGTTVSFVRPEHSETGSLSELAESLKEGQVKTLLILGGNPAYTAPADLGFADLVKKAEVSVHLSDHADETSQVVTWHIPRSHSLEAWGDLTTEGGTSAIVQPLIAPLFETRSEIEVLGHFLAASAASGHELVRETWKGALSEADFEALWAIWLNDGVIQAPAPPQVEAAVTKGEPTLPASPVNDWNGLASSLPFPAVGDGLEVDFLLDASVYDGRYANLGWLQELPDPMTKLTWDNAALISAATARKLGVASPLSTGTIHADVVTLTVDGRSVKIPVFVAPGTADDVLVLPLGYGRTYGGRLALSGVDEYSPVGVDVFPLRSVASPWFASGAAVKKAGGTYELATTQDHGRMEPAEGWEPRPVFREASLEEFAKEPAFVEKYEVIEKGHAKSLWQPPNETGGQQWGMTIDLNSCTGCNACAVACQAENNIMVVGKERVLNGRELHWIRLDRYYTGSEDNPEAVLQPMACAHCETAPCEGVCPVGATIHSPEGLNDMAYNRCIGTRYCANNCPFKVRRFNFFNFSRESDEARPLAIMQRNPDVTVRFRGVMEKCTYCVQRINGAKIEAHVRGESVVKDGAITPACAQACPASAIVFGDINDPESRVSKLKKEPRNYGLFNELNLHVRTSYLAKIRNPNPELV